MSSLVFGIPIYRKNISHEKSFEYGRNSLKFSFACISKKLTIPFIFINRIWVWSKILDNMIPMGDSYLIYEIILFLVTGKSCSNWTNE